jgi:hypothetical protein
VGRGSLSRPLLVLRHAGPAGAAFGERLGQAVSLRRVSPRFVLQGPSLTSSSDADRGHLRDPPNRECRGSTGAMWSARWVPGRSPGRGTGGPASESPGFAPHRRAQPEGHRAQRRGVSVPRPCTWWCPSLIRNDPSCTRRQSTATLRPFRARPVTGHPALSH